MQSVNPGPLCVCRDGENYVLMRCYPGQAADGTCAFDILFLSDSFDAILREIDRLNS